MPLIDYQADMERCSQCTYCEFVPFDQLKSWKYGKGCPSIAKHYFISYAARGRFAVALSLLKGKSTYSEKVKDIVYKCQTCGSCDVSCKVCRYNLEPVQTFLELRAQLVEDGQTLPEHVAVVESIKNQGNILKMPRSERGKWAEGLDVKRLAAEKAPVLFFAGCRYSYDPKLQESARNTVNLLKKAGVDIGIMGSAEQCCGGRIFNMGYRKDFTTCAANNIEAWKRAGVKTIITPCSDCYHTFKRLYASRMGSQFEVLHVVEYLEKLIKEGQIKFTKSVPMTITYHDPCHLGRQGEPFIPWDGQEKKIYNQIVVYEPRKPRYNGAWGIYDAPRNVLKAIPGIELVEMERIREYAWCCGAGGGVREAYPEFSNWTATQRINEAMETGAEAIVSACPWCEQNFGDAIKAIDGKMKVLDVAELVQQAL
ncbi:MAG: (Fe-S)-binding protein [Dehalococcoidales bacterium]|nr:(Fe-S)-binding protein [Dehalococcoidales bacterium]